MVRDALGVNYPPLNKEQVTDTTFEEDIGVPEQISDDIDDATYKRLSEACDKELYLGCKYSNLSFTLHLYHIKCISGISNNAFGF